MNDKIKTALGNIDDELINEAINSSGAERKWLRAVRNAALPVGAAAVIAAVSIAAANQAAKPGGVDLLPATSDSDGTGLGYSAEADSVSGDTESLVCADLPVPLLTGDRKDNSSFTMPDLIYADGDTAVLTDGTGGLVFCGVSEDNFGQTLAKLDIKGAIIEAADTLPYPNIGHSLGGEGCGIDFCSRIIDGEPCIIVSVYGYINEGDPEQPPMHFILRENGSAYTLCYATEEEGYTSSLEPSCEIKDIPGGRSIDTPTGTVALNVGDYMEAETVEITAVYPDRKLSFYPLADRIYVQKGSENNALIFGTDGERAYLRKDGTLHKLTVSLQQNSGPVMELDNGETFALEYDGDTLRVIPEGYEFVLTKSPVFTQPANDTAPVAPETTDKAGLIGICGEVFDPDSFEEKPDYVLNDYQYYRTDYGYTALFDGKTYNSYDDPEKFDLDNSGCTEQCEPASGGFIIVNKGDEIGGLSCTDAYAEYYTNTVSPLNDPFGLMSSTVSFEGEIEVTGYIDCFNGSEGYVDKGEMYFYPDDESWQGRPIPYSDYYHMVYSLNDGRLIYAPFRLSLGTVYDYSALELEQDISENSTVHVRCVLKDVQFKYSNSNFGGSAVSSATVVSAEIIDEDALMLWPVGGDGGKVTETMEGYGGFIGHNGVDIAAPEGTPVFAAASGEGEVTLAEWNYGYGNCVIIRHDDGLETLYAHLSSIDVKEGQRVARGDKIGEVGATGQTTEAALHFEVRKDGECVYPLTYLNRTDTSLESTAEKAAIAYLSNEAAELKKYLSDPNYDTGLSDSSTDLYDKVENMTVKHLVMDDGVCSVIYQYQLEGAEMLFYLNMELEKTESGWKVNCIFNQG